MDQYDEIKELIKFNLLREDSLNNSRLTWLLTFQGFLFTAYALDNSNKLEVISNLIPKLGILSSFVTFILVLTSIRSMYFLHEKWLGLVVKEKDEKNELTPFGIQKKGRGYFLLLLGLSPILPLSCTITWLIIACKLSI